MRPKTSGKNLPPRMLCRTKKLVSGKTWSSYYYNGRDETGRRVEIPLGKDLNEAKRKWAELECTTVPVETSLMKFVFDKYYDDVIPTKAPRTQKDNRHCLKMLRRVFDNAPIDSITPYHIAMYRDNRKSQRKDTEGQPAKIRANREIALFSNIWNMAREWNYTAKENPVRGVRKNKEKPRDFYADPQIWDAVYAEACVELRDAMDLSYLTGQRPADVRKMRHTDIKNGALELKQDKTQKKLRILLDTKDDGRTKLGQLIDRIKARDRKVASIYIVATPAGIALTEGTLRTRFDDARAAAARKAEEAGDTTLAASIRAFQFRDIRPKAASETDLQHASKLLGHTEEQITRKVYRRIGETVLPTK